MNFLEDQSSKTSRFFTFDNPLKLFILIIEMIDIMGDRVTFSLGALIYTRNQYYELAKNYIQNIKDEALIL